MRDASRRSHRAWPLKIAFALATFATGLAMAGVVSGAGALGAFSSISETDPPSTATTSTETTTDTSASPETSTETTESTPTETTWPAASEPYLVKFASGTSSETQSEILAAAGAEDLSYVRALRVHGVLLPGGDSLAASLDLLTSNAVVTRVEADRERETAATPNDSAYGDQWALNKIGWENVFGAVSPSGMARVAILDTGIDGSHSDLDGNVVPGTSILDGSDGLSDANGHGTAMAGIVAAETNNGNGVAGVGYAGVQVMPVTVLGADGTGQDSDIIEGVVYAAENDADVILMAFSNPGYSELLQEAIDYAWSEGVVLVAAVGNDGSSSPTFPAGDRGVIGVSSTNQSDQLDSSSNYGQAVYLGAPGTGIPTTSAGGGTASISGTSAAAAHVAGAAALLKAASGASNGVIVARLAKNAEPAGSRDQTGNGRLNVDRALADASTDSIQPSGADPVGSGGPIVGPYKAASNGDVNGVISDSSTSAALAGATVSVTCVGCNGIPAVAYAGGGTSTNATGQYSVSFSYPGNGPATVTVTASKPGYVPSSGSSATVTCSNNGTCTGSPFTRNLTLTPAVRSTSTTVSCSPASVALAQASTCTATVSDTGPGTGSFPEGTVTFSATPPASGSFSSASCSLSQVGTTTTSSCQVTYTPTATPGTHTIAGSYGGSGAHSASVGSFGLGVILRSTSTTVSCSPVSVAAGEGSVCTATVADTASGTKSAPTGSVSFESSGTGAFSSPGTSCTLGSPTADSSSCSVTYTPSAIGTGTHAITATYGGSSPHAGSSGTFGLGVTERSTATVVDCQEPRALDQDATCTATVSDSDGGSKSDPAGSVDWSRAGAGSGTFSAASCTLVSDGNAATFSSSCQVTYTPTAGAGEHTVTGTYAEAASALHAGSSGSDDITVTKRDTATGVTCTPTSVVVDQGTTCTAVVSDTDGGTKSAPGGTVVFSTSGAGTFASGTGTFTAPSTCTLAPAGPTSSSCSVTYTPSGAGSGTHTITGAYQGSALHETSSGTFGVSVEKRTTATSVSCSPLVNQIGTSSACTATVTDTEVAGTKSPPEGTVTFTFVNGTTGTTTDSCTLAAAGPASSSCNVSYSSTSPAVVTVTAAYGGSNVHKPSDSAADPVFVVFFDPEGGFVTGGGWISAEVGSCSGLGTTYSCSPTLTGKANFGFVSKYQKGANVPSGNTEFQFHAAGLNFKSKTYEWLVVAGSKAQFKGTGTINGAGNYTFQLFANDNTPGGPDQFRIKIWETATEIMIFDNKNEQAIDGGSIVIHKAK